MSAERELRDRIEYLEAENANYRDMLTGEGENFEELQALFRLTIMEVRVLQILLKGRVRDKEVILTLVYGEKFDLPEAKIMDVWIAKIRTKLRPHGISIETDWGIGYHLTDENRQKIQSKLDGVTP